MIFVDCTHTAHCHANTGIQRVTRRIIRELGDEAAPVIHDLYGHYWRTPDAAESELITYPASRLAARKRGAAWSRFQKWRGRLAAMGLHRAAAVARQPAAAALIMPEIFAPPRTPAAYAALHTSLRGPTVAIFHDLIPLLMPGHTPAETVAKFEAYLAALRSFDAIAAVSEFSREALIAYWQSRGESHPPVHAIPPGVDIPGQTCPPPLASPGRRPVLLCVGTLEGRKNHLALLQAAESLWQDGLDFELTLFGGLNRETAAAAAALTARLIQAARPLRWIQGGSDDAMEIEYARADFTVYPSLMEGFGLPVWESLARGRPCLCSGENAMAETSRAGGCLTIGHPTPGAIAAGIRELVTDRARLTALQHEAAALKIRSWGDYAADLRQLIAGTTRAPLR